MAHLPIAYAGATFERDCFTARRISRAGSHIVAKFTSPLAFAQYATTADTASKVENNGAVAASVSSSPEFFGTDSLRSALADVVRGAPDLTAKVAAISGKITATIARGKTRTIRHVVGGRVCVPDLLAGSPTPMRRRVKVADPLAPLTVVVNLVSSGGVPAADLLTRGVACGALVKHLTTQRQVTLYAMLGGQVHGCATTIALVQIKANPLDMTRATYVLAEQGMARALGFACYANMASDGADTAGMDYQPFSGRVHWPFGSFDYAAETDDNFDAGAGAPVVADLSKYLGAEVLYIPGAFVGSKSMSACLADPAAWVNAMAAKYSKPKLAA